MTKFDNWTATRIKAAARIDDVVGAFCQLKRAGRELTCACPFHIGRKLGHFKVNPSKGIYHCFVCGEHGDAVAFLMNFRDTSYSYTEALTWLAQRYGIPVEEDGEKRVEPARRPVPLPPPEPERELLVLPRELVRRTMDDVEHRDTFVEWFRGLPWGEAQRERIKEMLYLYCVGHFKQDGRTVFWQIDEQGRPHSGKLMMYHENGKRWREPPYGNPGWVHNQIGVRERLDLNRYGFRPALFGCHLLCRYPEAAVHVVESEKTALICAVHYGRPERNLWMACGGLQFLNERTLSPLVECGRKVYLWPDKDGVEKWTKKLEHIECKNIQLYTEFIDKYWLPEDGEKADVADIILRLMLRPETATEKNINTAANERFKIFESLCRRYKTMEALRDKFLLEPV